MDNDGALADIVEFAKERGFDPLKGAKAAEIIRQEVVDDAEAAEAATELLATGAQAEANLEGVLVVEDAQGDLAQAEGDLAQLQGGTKAQMVMSLWQRRASELMTQEMAAAHVVFPTHVYLSEAKRSLMSEKDIDDWNVRKNLAVSAARATDASL